MSPHLNWDSPTPLAASECALPPDQRVGGAHSPAAKGVGESQFQRLEKRLALCLLCDAKDKDYVICGIWQEVSQNMAGSRPACVLCFLQALQVEGQITFCNFLWFTIHLRIYLHRLYSAARILNCHVDNRPEAKIMKVQFR
jgi:hypothetical protein